MIRFWCEKKTQFINERKAVKKCINKNVKVRNRVCPHLKRIEDEEIIRNLEEAKDDESIFVSKL